MPTGLLIFLLTLVVFLALLVGALLQERLMRRREHRLATDRKELEILKSGFNPRPEVQRRDAPRDIEVTDAFLQALKSLLSRYAEESKEDDIDW